MFSANENLTLRQDKRRVVAFVEEAIPDHVLDAGTMVLAMQVSCRAPGCVPLETVICVVFPRTPGGEENELLPGLAESKSGCTYKTKVLKPMAEITKQDVLEALPPQFVGGLRSTEKLCLQARDVMLAQVTQLMGDDDLEGKRLMASYLQQCLQEYIDRDCIPPEYGEPFPDTPVDDDPPSATSNDNGQLTNSIIQSTGNFVVRRAADNEDASPTVLSVAPNSQETRRNTVVHRTHTKEDDKPGSVTATATESSFATLSSTVSSASSMDWRRQQSVNKAMSSQSIISRLSEREHPPGVRRTGCPCCDPDNPNNYVDSMMML